MLLGQLEAGLHLPDITHHQLKVEIPGTPVVLSVVEWAAMVSIDGCPQVVNRVVLEALPDQPEFFSRSL
jgi:hypothetical protein